MRSTYKHRLKSFVCCLLMTAGLLANAQIVPKVISPEEAAKRLTGKGVAITNISYSGDTSQIGSFTFPNHNNINFPFADGIMLSTGSVYNTNQPKLPDGRPVSTKFAKNGDEDCGKLATQLTNKGVRDGASLIVDFATLGDSVEFEFVFASNEYPEFITKSYYDVFCLLLKGPGIPFDLTPGGNMLYNDSFKNLAKINGSTVISVKTINDSTNSSYYVNSQTTNMVQFDGFTVSIKVKAAVQCGKQYRLKFAISDVFDDDYDSWIFLKGGSLGGNGDVGEITNDTTAICSNRPINLHITGSNSFRYLWNNEVVGKDYTVYPQYTGQEYSCVITDTATGCSITKKFKVGTLYTSNNEKPYTTGINETRQYDTFIQANHLLKFDVVGYDHQENELVQLLWDNQNVGDFGNDPGAAKNPKRQFSWTPTENDIGEHKIKIIVWDNNPCNPGKDTFIYTITVVCHNCPIDIYYENRSLSHDPVIEFTVAAHKIVAGTSVDPNQTDGPVVIGKHQKVTFWAGKEIDLLPGFEVTDSSDFTAEVKPVCTKKEFCDTCCNHNSGGGFTISHINNFITPGGDGINDYFQVLDVNHPECAYNAFFFKFQVFDRYGVLVFESTGGDQDKNAVCCQFKSPRSPDDNSRLASINWDGNFNRGTPPGGHACCGDTYFALLELKGCNGSHDLIDLVLTVFAAPYIKPARKSDSLTESSQHLDTSLHIQQQDKSAGKKQGAASDQNKVNLYLYPNPNNGVFEVYVEGWEASIGSCNLILMDAQGRNVYETSLENARNTLNLNYLESGVYTAKLQYGNKILLTKVVIESQ